MLGGIISAIFTVIVIVLGICTLKYVNKSYGIWFLIIMVPIMLIVTIHAFFNGQYGSYSELVKKYDMTHTIENGYSMYSKDNLTFKYTDGLSGSNSFEINDSGDKNIKYQDVILNSVFGYQEGTAILLYNYLRELGNNINNKSSIVIEGNHQKMKVTYDNLNDAIKYEATVIDKLKEIKTYDNETKNIHNDDYDHLYVDNMVTVSDYNLNYQEYYNQFGEYLFNNQNYVLNHD